MVTTVIICLLNRLLHFSTFKKFGHVSNESQGIQFRNLGGNY